MLKNKLTTVEVDFNHIGAEGGVKSLRSRASGPLHQKQRVLLRDDEGNSAEGVISKLDGNLLTVDVDWETWTQGSTDSADFADKIGLGIALLAAVVVAVSVGLLIGNIWVGIIVAVAALLVIFLNQ